MSNEVSKFNPEEAMNKIRERIKLSFLELLPDEELNKMVKQEVDNFFIKPISSRKIEITTNQPYGSRETITSIKFVPKDQESLFTALVYDVIYVNIINILQTEVVSQLDKDKIIGTSEHDMKELIAKYKEDFAVSAISRFFSSMIQLSESNVVNQVNDMAYRLRQGGY